MFSALAVSVLWTVWLTVDASVKRESWLCTVGSLMQCTRWRVMV